MASSTAVFGSTGLTGAHILSILLSSGSPATVQTISRRAPKSAGPTLQATIEPDTSLWASRLATLTPAPTTVISAVGTTRAAAGGLPNQWKIDHDLNVELAQAAKKQGVRNFVFISSDGIRGPLIGRLPYSRMKQGVEDTIKGLDFEHAIIVKPGAILGTREVPHQGSFLVNGLIAAASWLGVKDKIGQDAEVIARAAVHATRLAEQGKAPSKYWELKQADIAEPTTNGADRPLIIGAPTGPEPPYPLPMEGKVIAGFGRGSKELGIPTANIPVDEFSPQKQWITDIDSGVYFGWAALRLPPSHPDHVSSSPSSSGFTIYPMVMSIGYNPFYKNTVRSAEVHVLHRFAADFYGVDMRLLLTGYIRQEKDYAGLEALIADINFDCEVAKRSLDRPAWKPREGVVVGAAGAVVADGTLDCSWLLRPIGER
ncbi:hypothetical protein B0T17DRAFT_589072 [Bombardia bombarda]|uniref:Riboflavin kinase n=1 Tax=Bombardia bombarda TaxID=252184 RepID=A0AA39X926_9PEZI|nr:hypothetical protein B0T17DRAFT_589072 [Bombardia bombarda]